MTRHGRLLALLLPALLLPAEGLLAQTGFSRYDIYGTPIDVSVSDLVQNDISYDNRAVRVHGRLELNMSTTGTTQRTYLLSDGLGFAVNIMPVNEVQMEFEDQGMRWMGGRVQITGLFSSTAPTTIAGTHVTGLPQRTRR